MCGRLFRFSSVREGRRAEAGGVCVVGEDVVAVDGEQGGGVVFRARWNARDGPSAPFRTLLTRLDRLWGVQRGLGCGRGGRVIFGVEQGAVGKSFPPLCGGDAVRIEELTALTGRFGPVTPSQLNNNHRNQNNQLYVHEMARRGSP